MDNLNNSDFKQGARLAIPKLKLLEQKLEQMPYELRPALEHEKNICKEFVEDLGLELDNETKCVITIMAEFISWTMQVGAPELDTWKPLNSMTESEFEEATHRLDE